MRFFTHTNCYLLGRKSASIIVTKLFIQNLCVKKYVSFLCFSIVECLTGGPFSCFSYKQCMFLVSLTGTWSINWYYVFSRRQRVFDLQFFVCFFFFTKKNWFHKNCVSKTLKSLKGETRWQSTIDMSAWTVFISSTDDLEIVQSFFGIEEFAVSCDFN